MKKTLFLKRYRLINCIAILFFIVIGIVILVYFGQQSSPPVSAHSASGSGNCHYWWTIGRGDCCGCGFLETYFKKRVWAAREISSMEATWAGEPCSNEATGGGNEVGCFQINKVHCGGTFVCNNSGHVVSLSANWVTCDNNLRSSHNNAVVACALSNGGTNWSAWGAAGVCNVGSPPAEQYFNPK